jgi:hypothetical protein
MSPLLVSLAVVLEIVQAVGPAGPCDEKVAEAIYEAATERPIWSDREDGIERTVTILTSLAMHEGSKNPNASGDQGRSFGLYGIMQPVWKWPVADLKDPKISSVLALGLVRQSFTLCAHRPWKERLSWYAASSTCGDVHPVILGQSRARMKMADEMMGRFFPEHVKLVSPGKPKGTT